MTTIKGRSLNLSPAKQQKNNTDLLMLDCDPELTNHPHSSIHCEEMCTVRVMGIGQPFFYQAELWVKDKRKTKVKEQGIGVFYEKAGKVYLDRQSSFNLQIDEGVTLETEPTSFYEFLLLDIVAVSSWVPEMSEIASLDNCFLFSDGLLKLEKNNIILCDNKGNTIAAGPKELSTLLSKNKSISINSLHLPPSTRSNRPKEGEIILNKQTKKLEIYIGGKWSAIRLEVDDENT